MFLQNYCRRYRCIAQLLTVLAPPLVLIGCGSTPKVTAPAQDAVARPVPQAKASPALPVLPPAGSGRGGYYMDDGPGDSPPEGLLDTPDPEPRSEPYSTRGNKPYTVFGKTYTPFTDDHPFKQRGIGSWYGKKFHGQKTSSGEPYDMYKMTAAHPTLPIPSYARVTNLANGKQVIVRVNDRGPFHSGRIIDLSYTAALKLGYLGKGSSELEVERILPGEIALMARSKAGQPAAPVAEVSPAAAAPLVPKPEPAAAVAMAVNLAGTEAARTLDDQSPVTPAVVPAIQTAPAQGYYLQLGAYSRLENAEAVRARLLKNDPTLQPVEVVEYGQFHRLYSGPFATRAEAAQAALRLQEGGAFKPMIVQR
jgi:rare lipoprotein A